MVASQLGGNYWVRVIDFALLCHHAGAGAEYRGRLHRAAGYGLYRFYAVGAYLAALWPRICWRYSRF